MTIVVVAGNSLLQPATVPHLAYPFTIFAEGAITVQQDSVAEVAACVEAICACPQGFRDDDPTFGIPSVLFATVPLNVAGISVAIRDQEDRADLTVTDSGFPDDASERQVTVEIGGVVA